MGHSERLFMASSLTDCLVNSAGQRPILSSDGSSTRVRFPPVSRQSTVTDLAAVAVAARSRRRVPRRGPRRGAPMAWARKRKVSDGPSSAEHLHRRLPQPRRQEAVRRHLPHAPRRPSAPPTARSRRPATARWIDPTRGEITFRELRRGITGCPRRQIEAAPAPATRPTSIKCHFLPVLRRPADGARSCPRHPGVGHQGHRRGPASPPPASRSTTWCCTRSSGELSATGSSPSTRAPRPSCPRSSRGGPDPHPRGVRPGSTPDHPSATRLRSRPASRPACAGASSPRLRPRHFDFLRRTLSIEETIVELPKSARPHGRRNVVKPYPKNNEPGTRPPAALLDRLAARIQSMGLGRDDLLFRPPRPAEPHLPQHLPHPRLAPRRRARRHRASTSASTTSATPTPPGSSPAAPTSSRRHGPHRPRPDPDHPALPPRPPRCRRQEPRRLHPHRRRLTIGRTTSPDRLIAKDSRSPFHAFSRVKDVPFSASKPT